MNNRRLNIPAVFLLLSLFLTFKLSAADGYFIPEYKESKSVDTIINEKQFKVIPFYLEIVAPSAGIQFFRDKIIFLSNTKDEHRMSRSQISFGAIEMYTAVINDTSTGQHVLFSPLSSFSYPADGVTFSNDFSTIYFTMVPKKGKREQIYMGKINSNKDNVITIAAELGPLPFCNAGYSYSHPSLMTDNNAIVFASDMPGTTGGMDLYVTRRDGDSWTEPVNLGIDINSAKNEFWPFLDEFNNLYFSSDRFGGFGGYDIYTSKFNGTSWNKPVLLDKNINSQDDDIALVINRENGRTGFFSRRAKNTKGGIQLYRIMTAEDKTNGSQSTIAEYFNGPAVKAVSIVAQQAPAVTSEQNNKSVITKSDKEINESHVLTEKKTDLSKEKESVKKEAAIKTDTTLNEKRLTETGNIFTAEKVTVKNKEDESKSEVKLPELHKKQEPVLAKKQEVKTDTLTKVTKSSVIENTVAEVKNPEKQNSALTVKSESKDQVIYKVQLLPVAADRKAGKMSINGVEYKISDYMYLGAVRYTIGEFPKLQDAVRLLRNCRQGGYDQSFVVAFRDNVRALEPELFK